MTVAAPPVVASVAAGVVLDPAATLAQLHEGRESLYLEVADRVIVAAVTE